MHYLSFFTWLFLFLIKLFFNIFTGQPIIWIVVAFAIYLATIVIQFFKVFFAYRGFFYDDQYKYIYKVLALLLIVFSVMNISYDKFTFDGVPKIL